MDAVAPDPRPENRGDQPIEGLHEQLEGLPGFQASDYHPGAVPGSVIDGIRSEDLCRLTYPDDSFDLVLTSESLEHVPDLAAALREILRVLVPGGRHIFTIPLLPGVDKDVRPDRGSARMARSLTPPRLSATPEETSVTPFSPSSALMSPKSSARPASR